MNNQDLNFFKNNWTERFFQRSRKDQLQRMKSSRFKIDHLSVFFGPSVFLAKSFHNTFVYLSNIFFPLYAECYDHRLNQVGDDESFFFNWYLNSRITFCLHLSRIPGRFGVRRSTVVKLCPWQNNITLFKNLQTHTHHLFV